jgi:hypothetical protein
MGGLSALLLGFADVEDLVQEPHPGLEVQLHLQQQQQLLWAL